jgi:hypothetical protein
MISTYMPHLSRAVLEPFNLVKTSTRPTRNYLVPIAAVVMVATLLKVPTAAAERQATSSSARTTSESLSKSECPPIPKRPDTMLPPARSLHVPLEVALVVPRSLRGPVRLNGGGRGFEPKYPELLQFHWT